MTVPCFLDRPLALEHLGGRRWSVTRRFRYRSAVPGVGQVTVHIGTVTDLASVPRWPVMFWLTGDTAHEAAVIHDQLYTAGRSDAGPVTRGQADTVFAEAMRVLGEPLWRRMLMGAGLWLGGGWTWRRHRREGLGR